MIGYVKRRVLFILALFVSSLSIFAEESIVVCEHEFYSDTVSLPTCVEEGSLQFTCGLCHDTTYYEVLPMVDHELVRDSVAATCQQIGHLTDSCVVCNQIISSIKIPQLEHAFVSDTVSLPTCVEEGSLQFTCGLCHDTTYYEVLPMVDHELVRDSVAATCQQIGHLTDSCVVCNQIISSIKIPQLEHAFVSDTVSLPTCVEEGSLQFTCGLCHDTTYYVSLPKVDHVMENEEVILPTCEEPGYTLLYCSICQHADTFAVYEPHGHMYYEEEILPTCQHAGYEIGICDVCKKRDTLSVSEPIEHVYYMDSIEPTCQQYGYEIGTCELCNRVDTLYVSEPVNHVLSYGIYQGPTCTEDGWMRYMCEWCNYYEETIEPAYGHNYRLRSEHSATCTTDGYETYWCVNCYDSYEKTIEAYGHDYQERILEPTPLSYGYTIHTCSRCSDEYKDHKVDKVPIGTYYSSLKINEVMPCNISTAIHPTSYNFLGYLEFYNSATHAVNIEGCVLNHYKKTSGGKYSHKWSHTFSSSTIGSSCQVLWSNQLPDNFDADGGYLTLYAGDYLIDSIAYGAMEPHVAYGRSGKTTGYMSPTPGAKNGDAFQSLTADRCAQPSFSVAPGVLSGATDVAMKCSTAGAAIYYTLDGTEPSATNGMLYSAPIEVEENTNIRAIACLKGKLPSKIATGSYILMDKQHAKCGGFTVPIVSITMDNLYYSDPKYGMFVVGNNGTYGEKDCQMSRANYNQDWKRPMNFEYFVDGKCVVSQEVEAAIEGGCSRGNAIKSFSMKTSKKSGASQFDYHFFESKPDVFTKTLHLRNGGTAYNCIPYRDGLMQTFAHGMNIDYQAYQPVAYYRNGQYIGMMALNERTNSDYIKSNHGYDEEDIDVLTVSDQLGIRVSKGSKDAYDELVSYLNNNKPSNPDYYAGACQRMDMDEYIDYQIFQQFIVNTDWPGNNTKIWRAKENGLFRWILFDTDFGFGLCGYEWIGTPDINMIDWCRGDRFTSWANQEPWMVEIFRPLSENKEFKNKFTTKFLIHLSDRFSEQNLTAVFDSVMGVISGEACADSRPSDSYYRGGTVESMLDFALRRPKCIYKHLTSYVEGDSVVNLKLESNVEGAVLTLNGEKLNSYNGKYIAGYDFDIAAYAPMGYVFDGWEISDEDHLKITSRSLPTGDFMPAGLSGKMNGQVSIKAKFKKGGSWPTLVINELCASSNSKSGNADDYNNYPDWIELYNYGTDDIDLSGFRLSNSKNDVVSDLPFDASDLVVKAGEHKILWAKGDSRKGSNYLSFKLDNDKSSKICLSYFDGDSYVDIDCMRYAKHQTNSSYGRVVDHGPTMTIFGVCDDSVTYAATPGASNGSMCEHYSVAVEDIEEEVGLTLYPNPAYDHLNLAAEEEILSYTIYDMSGSVLRREFGNSTTISVDGLSTGLYMIEVKTVNNVYRLKFIKE